MAAVAVCVILAAASIAFWQMNQGAQAAMVYPHPGLVGWWGFDEGSGSVAGDSSGNGNNGTIYGATWATGRYGQALSFDGVSNYVNIPYAPSLNPTTAITLEAWIKRADDVGTRSWIGIVSRWPSSYILYLLNDKAAIFILQQPGVEISQIGSTTIQKGVWYHIVGTYDGSYLHIYVNGVEDKAPRSYSNGIASSNLPLRIGKDQTEVDYFNGIIDEVHIYNRALSAAEIQADFKEGPDFSTSLLAKVPQGTTQVITTLSWQGTGSINVTIVSPSQNYTENMLPEYQKTVYSTSSGAASMLNIKRLSVSVSALSSDQNWYVVLTFDNVDAYQITVEVQK